MSSGTTYRACIFIALVSIFREISGVEKTVEYQGGSYVVETTCLDRPTLDWCYNSVDGWTNTKCTGQDTFRMKDLCTPEPCLPEFTYGGATYKNSCTCEDHHISWCYTTSGWKDCGIMEKLQGMSDVYDKCECYHSEWTSWSACDATCGDGNNARARSVITPNTPKPCSLADETEHKKCDKIKPCPVDGGLGDWTPWTDCTASCGGGTTTRTRQCNNPTPMYGGKDCTIYPIEHDTCKTSACPVPDGIDDCASSPCTKGTCVDLNGGYTCECPQNVATCEQVKLCRQIADVVFVIDESGSIGPTNFEKVRNFFSDITEELPIDMRIGAVAFNLTARRVVEFTDPTTAKAQIRAMKYLSGGTAINTGLAAARAMLTSARSGAEKIMVVFTDGINSYATGTTDTKVQADQAKNEGIKILCVGVGSNLDFALLDEISHDYMNFLQIKDWPYMQLATWNQYQRC